RAAACARGQVRPTSEHPRLTTPAGTGRTCGTGRSACEVHVCAAHRSAPDKDDVMRHEHLIRASGRWFPAVLPLYPADFREQTGAGVVDAYREHARVALSRSGPIGLARLWLRALV